MQTAQEKSGSVLGGMLLITGSCVGAGMLGLPILTGMAGFFPSLIMFSIACLFMTITGLFLVEVGQWFDARANFSTIISKMLGPFGKALCWILYLFLFYALLVAYIADSGVHSAAILKGVFSKHFPIWFGSVFFVAIFGSFVYFGTRPVDLLNRFLMFAKITSYLGLIVVSMSYVTPALLEYVNPKYAFFSLPVLVVSFGFHNMIPTLSGYLNGDTKRIRQSIIGGAILTLSIYLFWQIIALGSLPVEGPGGILDSFKRDFDAATALKNYAATPTIGSFALSLAFFGILTSFLAQSLSLVHFLSDGMRLKQTKRESILACCIALLPCLIVAIVIPGIFYKALNFAGISAVVLFGIFPVLMVWIGRYRRNLETPYRVFGGKTTLYVIFAIAVFVFLYQGLQTIGLDFFPKP